MRHPDGTRFERRLRARQEARRLAEQDDRSDPSMPPLERREGERRVRAMTSTEVEDWLKRNGITGGDRRKGDRRRR